MSSRNCLALTDLGVTADGKQIVGGISHTFYSDRFVCLFGKSGTGKSTVLKSLCGLIPFTGTIALDDTDILRMHPAKLRRMVHYVPQFPVLPEETVKKNLLIPFTFKANRDLSATPEQLGEALQLVGLAPDYLDRTTEKLSGGEKQRVQLARALLLQPKFLLLDEPTASLDMVAAEQITELLGELKKRIGIIAVSHTREFILAADEKILLKNGTFAETFTDMVSDSVLSVLKG